jgi:pimeloyl-ACP methyl ester carboxylesterase
MLLSNRLCFKLARSIRGDLMNSLRFTPVVILLMSLLAALMARSACADDFARIVRLDHYLSVRSTVPAIAGQMTAIYVHEVVRVNTALGSAKSAKHVVLFVHGGGTPAEVAFDLQYQDYSWMEFLAQAGFDVFAMDMTGYGRSTRPNAMNDPCNLSAAQQLALAPATPACAPSYGQQMTTLASDWNDLGNVVDFLRTLRGVQRVNLVGWSLGSPRAAGYAEQNPDKVERLVLLAPTYTHDMPSKAPTNGPAPGPAMNTQSQEEFMASWDSQVGCAEQYDPRIKPVVWQAMVDSDPVATSWGSGLRRAPNVTNWGWTAAVAAATKSPVLMVTGETDKQIVPSRVHDLYADLGSKSKVLIDLACSSHNAIWEYNHLLLFQASLEWLTKGTFQGLEQGMVRLGH